MALATASCRHVAPAPAAASFAEGDEGYRQMERLVEVMLLVKKHYVEDESITNILTGALNGMLHSLDEHSDYLDPEQVREMQEDTAAQYGGVGIWLGVRDNALAVIAPVEDSPAFRAGILAQDLISKIDGDNAATLSLRDAVQRLRGEPGTKVSIAVQRQQEPAPRTFVLVREAITVPTVKGTRMLGDGIGYTRITQFAEPTAASVHAALETLRGKGMKALVLDLRSNPGGLLVSAKEVAETFLPRGALVVSIRDRTGKAGEKRLTAEGNSRFADLPLVILIDRGSASASEIVAGALRDHKRATLVGDRSYGKGSVQTVIPLTTETQAALRLTTAKYYTPSEKEIQDLGIEPDVAVTVSPAEWMKIQLRRAHEEDPRGFTAAELKADENVRDSALERAVELLRVRLGGAPAPVAPAAGTNAATASSVPITSP